MIRVQSKYENREYFYVQQKATLWMTFWTAEARFLQVSLSLSATMEILSFPHKYVRPEQDKKILGPLGHMETEINHHHLDEEKWETSTKLSTSKR